MLKKIQLGLMFVSLISGLRSASCDDIPDEVLKCIGNWRESQPDPKLADELLVALKNADLLADKRMLFYQAIALEAKGDKEEAQKQARAASDSGYKPTFLAARYLARRLSPDMTPGGADRMKLWLDVELVDFPYGLAEERKLIQFNGPKGEVEGKFFFHAKTDTALIVPAAYDYTSMNMWESAQRIYKRIEGWEGTSLGSGMGAWQDMAEFYKLAGKWELAEGYMIKAMIGHGLTQKRLQFIREIEANIKSNKQIASVKQVPDAKKLEGIVLMCADAQLFPDAFRGIEEMKDAGAVPSVKTQLTLHQDIAKMIEDMNTGRINDVNFRGIDVNAASLAKEKQIIEDLKKRL